MIHERILELREFFNLDIQTFAKIIFQTEQPSSAQEQLIRDIEEGNVNPTTQLLEDILVNIPQINEYWLLFGQGSIIRTNAKNEKNQIIIDSPEAVKAWIRADEQRVLHKIDDEVSHRVESIKELILKIDQRNTKIQQKAVVAGLTALSLVIVGVLLLYFSTSSSVSETPKSPFLSKEFSNPYEYEQDQNYQEISPIQKLLVNQEEDQISFTFDNVSSKPLIFKIVNDQDKIFYQQAFNTPRINLKIDIRKYPRGKYYYLIILEDEVVYTKSLFIEQ